MSIAGKSGSSSRNAQKITSVPNMLDSLLNLQGSKLTAHCKTGAVSGFLLLIEISSVGGWHTSSTQQEGALNSDIVG
jgi:hypothetical protein